MLNEWLVEMYAWMTSTTGATVVVSTLIGLICGFCWPRKTWGLIFLILGFCGVFAGAYLGIMVMFVGGIVEIIDGIKMVPTDAHMIAFGILRIIFAAPAGWIAVFISAAIFAGGGQLFFDSPRRRWTPVRRNPFAGLR